MLILVHIVALRKESVDRNLVMLMVLILLMTVALRKESVDRNVQPLMYLSALRRRSP